MRLPTDAALRVVNACRCRRRRYRCRRFFCTAARFAAARLAAAACRRRCCRTLRLGCHRWRRLGSCSGRRQLLALCFVALAPVRILVLATAVEHTPVGCS